MSYRRNMKRIQTVLITACLLGGSKAGFAAQALDFFSTPSFLTSQVPPLVMLVMGKNHKLFYEAYNDSSDLNEDGVLDIGYKGEDEPYTDANTNGQWDIGESYTDTNSDGKWTPGIDYYGYFDSNKCYEYSGDTFVPVAAPVDGYGYPSKKCTGANDAYWSGDMLNYLTMSRMDALRKVLYGGYRSTDTTTSTVLQRVYVPQDAHSWGKEYESIAIDGYDIREYTPLNLPAAGFRHLFANTTLSDNGDPLLRVLNDSKYRVIEWVSIERPVAGDRCLHGGNGPYCEDSGGDQWEIVPPNAFVGLTQTTYDTTGYGTYPNTKAEFDNLETSYGIAANEDGTGPAMNINGSGNPYGDDLDYMTIFEGKIKITADGNYEFAVDGDDAVDVLIDGTLVASFYGDHGVCGCYSHNGSIYLTAGEHDIKFRHQEKGGDDAYDLYWNIAAPSSVMTDYEVRVEVCNSAFPENNCNVYPNGNYKPVGLLQRYGEDEKMYFGLLSGSYAKNMSGGVLRKNVSSINDEIDIDTGQILAPADGGIIDTLNKIRISEFNYSNNYSYPGGWVTTRPMNDGEFRDWGNPVGEMMYETIRYFAGKSGPTPAFDFTNAGSMDENLGLPKPAWDNPYDTFERCASPYMLVLSDIFPTFDSDQLHGIDSAFGSGLAADDFSTGASNTEIMDVSELARAISNGENISGNYYIGQESAAYDGSCSPKFVDNFGAIRGMCPEEPTKQGSFYAAAVAYYGAKYDINPTEPGAQRVSTFTVGIASPLPKINIDVPDGAGGTKRVTLVPFAKSVDGSGISDSQTAFQPTNTITDFYAKKITPTEGTFEVNFEDVEQGADHDMDAVVVYDYSVTAAGDIKITLSSTYAAGGIEQHMGYIISGTTADGVYLEVRDKDTAASNDNDYFLDTPPGEQPGGNWNDGAALPLVTTRVFKAGNTPGASLLENPLYYAAKWGGYLETDDDEDLNKNGYLDPGEDLNGNGRIDFISSEDTNGNGTLDAGEDLNGNGVLDHFNAISPDKKPEWDRDGDDVPDSYFYVVNPLKLEEQIGRSFAEMLRRASSGTAASVISSSRSGEGAVYQSVFYPEYKDSSGQIVQWSGMIRSLLVDAYGNMRVDMYTDQTGSTIYDDLTRGPKQLNFKNEDLNYNGIFDTGLNEDANGNGILDAGEDLNNNGRLDTDLDEVDYDEDGQVDYRDLIVVLSGGQAELWDDKNENGIKDVEDRITFSPDIPAWHNNGVLDTEDTNGNGLLDGAEVDLNGNNRVDSEDVNGNGMLDTELIATGYDINDLNYLWNSMDWLDSFTMDPLVQRGYGTWGDQRYIFTFVDQDGDMIADSGETMGFLAPSVPSVTDLTDTNNFLAYMNLHPTFDDKPAWVTNIEGEGNRDAFLTQQAKRVVDFVRGKDQGDMTVGSYGVPAMRSRQYRDSNTSLDRTWRLGDIVSSSPTLVARPAEGYHLIYRDDSYAYFLARHLNRRNVIYVGGNDGMIHAFNGGFYDYQSNSYKKALAEPFIDLDNDNVYDSGEPYADWNNSGNWTNAYQTQHDLGAELWGYVPFNQLAHLYWLTEQTYPHVYYNDLTPKIFDAKIFPYDPADPLADPDRPYGWGTIMVMGMRLGGGNIVADTDRDNIVDATDKQMKSAYVILDITNPEEPPTLLAEITLPGLGYTTCYPTVIPMRSKSGSGSSVSFNSNDWYLVFGSGPADANGIPASLDASGVPADTGTIGEPRILTEGVSLQNGKIFAVSLNALTDDAGGRRVEVVDETGALATVTGGTAVAHMEEFEAESYVSRPITVDYDLNFNADAVYFGSVEWNAPHSTWGGKLKRLIIEEPTDLDSTDTLNWVGTTSGGIDRADNHLVDLTYSGTDGSGNPIGTSQPITAAASVAVGKRVFFDIDASNPLTGISDDFDRERWLFFGTGRFEVSTDASDNTQQSYYGIKEPYNTTDPYGFTWGEVDRLTLLDSTNIDVWDDRRVDNHPDASVVRWDEMISDMEGHTSYPGWYIDFLETNERNIGQAALLGGLLTFTTYKPSLDPCFTEGSSNLYARWYQTGTPFYRQIFSTGNEWVDADNDGVQDDGETKITGTTDLGTGMALTPNIHTGRKEGSTAYIQTSTGDIITIEQEEAEATKSNKTSWTQQR